LTNSERFGGLVHETLDTKTGSVRFGALARDPASELEIGDACARL
jgi:hypothetical protein